MDTNAVWDAALKDVSPEVITEYAQRAPKALSNASAPEQEDGLRGTGLLLTKKQIIDLRRYEASALALPFVEKDVKDYLNFGDDEGGGSGLGHEDFLKTFSTTRRHAQRWSPLRESIMLIGSELKIFANSMSVYGNDVEELYQDVRASGLLDKHDIKTLEQLKRVEVEQGVRFPGIELEPDIVSDLDYFLGQIFKKIKNNLSAVKIIRDDLNKFGNDLSQHILPDIKLRIVLAGSTSLPVDVEKLEGRIKDRALQIDEKNKEYKEAVSKSISAVTGMNVVGLALAIYQGVEAENIRAERNKLYKEQEADIEKLKNKNRSLGSLVRVKHDLQGLVLVSIDANIATQNLIYVWNVLHLYIGNSQDAVAKINDALSLRRFISAFRLVVTPWKQIGIDADALIAVFKEADEEYERTYGEIRGVKSMAMKAIPMNKGYPSVELNIMAESVMLMRDSAVKSSALFIQWNYLPQLHQRFHTLVLNVSESSSVLSGAALRTKMKLENRIDRLESLEKELAEANDEQDIGEIQADRADLLAEISPLIDQSVRQLSDQLLTINSTFNQRLTHGFIDDLENDQLKNTSETEKLSAEWIELKRERRIITEAIDALTQGGVEKMGQNMALTLEGVVNLGIAPPKVQLVMLAIEQLKRTIAQIGEGIRFLDMVRERDRLVTKIYALGRAIEMKQDEFASLTGKVKLIQAIHAIDDQRRRYVSEYQRALKVFQTFAMHIETDQQVEARKFIEFLRPLSLPLPIQ